MNQNHRNTQQRNVHFLSKAASTRSCENLLCLTKRCNQDEAKQKQRILNNQYFQKLSLKKFNNSTLINHSFYQKDKGIQRSLRRDRSTEENEFQNIVLNPHTQQPMKYSLGNVPQSRYHNDCHFEESRRIARCSSYRRLQKPMVQTTDRSMEKQIQQDFHRIQELQKLRRRLETEIRELDQNIDKYYHIYHSKLQELRGIQSRMSELGGVEKSLNRIPSNDQLRPFKKKSFWEEFDGNKIISNPNNPPTLDIPTTRIFNYNKSPINFSSDNDVSFVKKAI